MAYIAQYWKRILYFLITGSTSIFIAACYGMPAAYDKLLSWTIKTRNEDNQPIKGLEVTVVQYKDTAATADTITRYYTDSTGTARFLLELYNENLPCRFEAVIKDIDVTENGGWYADTAIAQRDSDESTVVMRPIR